MPLNGFVAPSATRKARRLMLRAATAKEYKAQPGGLQGGEIDFESWGVQIPIKKSSKITHDLEVYVDYPDRFLYIFIMYR